MIKNVAFTFAFSIICIGLACSESDRADTEVSLALDWFPNSNHAGIYVALNNGFFEDEGLEVNVYTPSDPASVLQSVGAGRDDFGISYQTDLLQARSNGVQVVSIMGIVQHPLNSIMTLSDSGITRPSQLRGKKIGYPGIPSNEGLLATMLESDGLSISDVQLVDVGFALVQALASNSVDAIIGAYWTHESIVLELEGIPVNIIRMEDWGVPDFYELVLITGDFTVKSRNEIAQKIVRALKRGFDHAYSDPQGSIDDLVMLGGDAVLTDVERRGVELLLPMWMDPDSPSFGWQETSRWNSFGDWMKSQGLIANDLDVSKAFTNEFIEAIQEK